MTGSILEASSDSVRENKKEEERGGRKGEEVGEGEEETLAVMYFLTELGWFTKTGLQK